MNWFPESELDGLEHEHASLVADLRRLKKSLLLPAGAAKEAGSLTGDTIGEYRFGTLLGNGSFGSVYRGEHLVSGKTVALKIPHPEILWAPESRKLFMREARLAASLNHPGILRVYHASLAADMPLIVSAFCGGPDLQQWIQFRDHNDSMQLAPEQRLINLDWRLGLEFMLGIGRAVAHAHDHGIAHRDLKPANILLSPKEGEIDLRNDSTTDDKCASMQAKSLDDFIPKVTDFGLAKRQAETTELGRSSRLMGTPLYMSPERLAGDQAIIQAYPFAGDVYSLGAVLFQLLTGRLPCSGDSYVELWDNIRLQPAVRLRTLRKDIPRDLDHICQKCLEKQPTARYRSAEEFADDLARCLRERPIVGKPLNKFQKLIDWCGRPRRIADAGWYLIWCQVFIFSWLLFTAIIGPFLRPPNPGEVGLLLHDLSRALFTQAIPMCAVGFWVQTGSPIAIVFAWVSSLLLLPLTFAPMFGVFLAYGFLYGPEDQLYASLIQAMLVMIHFGGIFALSCGMYARFSRAIGRSKHLL